MIGDAVLIGRWSGCVGLSSSSSFITPKKAAVVIKVHTNTKQQTLHNTILVAFRSNVAIVRQTANAQSLLSTTIRNRTPNSNMIQRQSHTAFCFPPQRAMCGVAVVTENSRCNCYYMYIFMCFVSRLCVLGPRFY